MRAVRRFALWCAAGAALFTPDALAWGLQTHVFLAQWALAAAPLADPQVRGAVARFPRLVLAGACLPDLALAGRVLRTTAFASAHRWSTLRRLSTACWDEERAIAVGYASHLLADVVAHHRFVPHYERLIGDAPHVAHALSEWAMDAGVRSHLDEQPAALLASEAALLAAAAARTFGCDEGRARHTLAWLARAEQALRISRLPLACRRAVGRFDAGMAARFGAFLNDARAAVLGIGPAMAGDEPPWPPEPRKDQVMAKDAPAIRAPSAAPAMTSLG